MIQKDSPKLRTAHLNYLMNNRGVTAAALFRIQESIEKRQKEHTNLANQLIPSLAGREITFIHFGNPELFQFKNKYGQYISCEISILPAPKQENNYKEIDNLDCIDSHGDNRIMSVKIVHSDGSYKLRAISDFVDQSKGLPSRPDSFASIAARNLAHTILDAVNTNELVSTEMVRFLSMLGLQDVSLAPAAVSTGNSNLSENLIYADMKYGQGHSLLCIVEPKISLVACAERPESFSYLGAGASGPFVEILNTF